MENNISDDGAKSLFSAFIKLRSLLTLKLFLENNDIGEDGALSIYSVLIQLNNLISLELNLK